MKKVYLLIIGIMLLAGAYNTIVAIDSPVLIAPLSGATTWNYVTLDWDSVAGSTAYYVQIDTAASFTSSAFLDITLINLPGYDGFWNLSDIYFGSTYFWRVKAYSATDTSSWSQTWNFTTRDDVVLVSPVAGTESYTRIMLDWDAHPGITYYDFEIDTSTTFGSPALLAGSNYFFSTTNTSFDTEENINTLYFGADYHWRVRARNNVDTSQWTTSSFATKDLVTLSSPLNNQLVPVGTTIDWLAFDGVDYYDYEVDETPSFSSPALISGSRVFISFDDNNTDTEIFVDDLLFGNGYYWRVRARHVVDTSAWTLGTFTTMNTLMLTSPIAGSIEPCLLTLDWQPHPGVDVYEYQVDISSSFNTLSLLQGSKLYINEQDGNSDTEQGIGPLGYGVNYFWRARTWNASDTSEWSQIGEFSTVGELTLVSPAALENTYTEVNFVWLPIEGSGLYQLKVDTTLSFNSPATSWFTLNGSSQAISNFWFGTNYYWTMRAINAVDTSEWNQPVKFFTRDQVGLVSPLNETLNADTLGVMLDWLSHPGAISYDLQMDSSNTFSSSFLLNSSIPFTTSDPNGTDTEYFTGSLDDDQFYFWRVRAINEVDTSEWEEHWFSTGAQQLVLPPVPGIISPLYGEVDVSTEPVLDWNDVSLAIAYYYQISSSSDLDGLSEVYISTSEATVSGLDYVTKYYWRVKSFDGNLVSDWSPTYNFTTAQEVLGIPSLLSPFNNSTNLNVSNLDMDWNDVYHAQKYLIQLATSVDFVWGMVSQEVFNSNATISGLTADSLYFWRVKAVSDTLVNGAWSEVWTFTTMGILDAPILLTPLNNSTGIAYDAATLSWDAVANAQAYELKYAQDPLFNIDYHFEITNVAYYLLPELQTATGYYWQVRATNDTLISSLWTDIWSFVTNDTSTSVNEIGEEDWMVYPNPSSGQLHIEFDTWNGNMTVLIIDVSGRLMRQQELNSGNTEMDISTLPEGVYNVMIRFENGSSVNRKLLKLDY
jgi:hypothetical protein